ncbi:hypothetical protein STANM309S_06036 [Streptomyces tanashiensis]
MIDWRGAVLGAWRGTRGGPTVTYGLIAACCLLFVISPVSGLNPGYGTGDELLAAQGAYFRRWGVVPAELMSGDARALLTPLTALFVHGSWLHLLGNMLFLYVFGAMAEERMGPVEFCSYYLGTGYIALLGYAVAHADSEQTLGGPPGRSPRCSGPSSLPLPPLPGSPASSPSCSSCRCASPPGSC